MRSIRGTEERVPEQESHVGVWGERGNKYSQRLPCLHVVKHLFVVSSVSC